MSVSKYWFISLKRAAESTNNYDTGINGNKQSIRIKFVNKLLTIKEQYT